MNAFQLISELIAFDSVSRNSNIEVACFVRDQLIGLGFKIEEVPFVDANGVSKLNLVAKRGPGAGGICYFSHSDVVPADSWSGPAGDPFSAIEKDNRIYGRGSCDMKGSIAVMLQAISRIEAKSQTQPMYFVCTGDEEVGFGGAKAIVAKSKIYREMVASGTRAIIGEPTQLRVVHGHKGICGFRAIARGRAAHSSSREGVNANLAMIPYLVEMKRIHDLTETDDTWQHSQFDPPTVSWNIGINDHTSASNITPAQSVCTVCFRPMPGQDADVLVNLARKSAEKCGLEFEVYQQGRPFLTDPRADFVSEALGIVGGEATTVAFGTDGGRISRTFTDDCLRTWKHPAGPHVGRVDCAATNPTRYRFIRMHDAPLVLRLNENRMAELEVTIRLAKPIDIREVHAFLEPFVTSKEILPRTMDELAVLLEHAFVAECDSAIVGFVAVEIYSLKLAEIQCLAVCPNHRGKGLGRDLVNCCIERARQQNVFELMAITASEKLFEDCGFTYSLPNQKRALFVQTREDK